MLKKIKEGWYVMIHKIDQIQPNDTDRGGYDYSIEGQQYSYWVNDEDGKLLLDAVDEFIALITDARLKQLDAIEKINNAKEKLAVNPEENIRNFIDKLKNNPTGE